MVALAAPGLPHGLHASSHVPSLALARAVADFAQRPLAHQHPSWLPREWPLPLRKADRFGPAAAQILAGPLALGGDEPARGRLLQALLDGRGDPLARLVLLDRSALRLLAVWCGMAVHKPGFASERSRLAQQLDGRLGALAQPLIGTVPYRLRRAARRFDPQAVAFILKRVPDLPDLPMNLDPIRARPSSAARVMAERGYRLLCGLVQALPPAASGTAQGDAPSALLNAVRRKFPRRLAALPVPALSRPQAAQLRELLLLNLIPERFPTWHWLF
ncbi:type III secretion system protein SctK [Cupriavidus gilardii]|uniref:Type III secretion system protein SctK n=1 Tax=Cupriavidus gilardii TaxID=82541 RepID=A0ABY4VKK0_9BURK|nr:type III secretion system protein SctK [Cupriavidus gilardii]MCT9073525.1 type III secretion system protein SctK [Cupriavidus gilardii]MCT9124883.1 type III secretion system protein SctK [Cupriavidus gilardii]QKS61464.1 type III secretion system protein SctK [Cupriavidus gilardii]USE77585.1 type III secretion system protein SctK [Cupriavidus gilardii]